MEIDEREITFLPQRGTVTVPKTGSLATIWCDDIEIIFDPPIQVEAGKRIPIERREDGTWFRID